MKPALISFQDTPPSPSFDHPRADRRVKGNPLRTTHEFFSSPHGKHYAGIWECEPGAWEIAFAENKEEFFTIIEGKICIYDEDGNSKDFSAGDACIIPSGFKGRFEVIERVRKHYVVVEHPLKSGV